MISYRELFELKFKEGVPTQELVRRFPGQAEQVSEVALLDVSEDILREIIHEEKILMRLMELKKNLFWRENA